MNSMRAKFGLSLSNRSVLFGWATTEQLIEAAIFAEDSGFFHGVWVGDNLLSKPRLDAIVTLSALAARTKQVKIGTICMASFPLRDPIQLAIQWASLDVLSQGRTILAVCNGPSARDGPQFAHELDVMGVGSNERVGRLIEGVKILRRLWSEESVTHEGKYYRFSDVELLPKPIQQPPPIFIAVSPREGQADEALVDRVLRRVAKHADGWQAGTLRSETFKRRFDKIREYAAKEGRDPSKLESCLHIMVNINEDKNKAFAEAEEYFRLYYGAGAITPECAEIWLAYGPPDEVASKINSYIEAGCTMPVLRFASRNFRAQLERCTQEVMPALQSV